MENFQKRKNNLEITKNFCIEYTIPKNFQKRKKVLAYYKTMFYIAFRLNERKQNPKNFQKRKK